MKLSNEFTLSFQYAARASGFPETSQANVYWNNVLIASLAPKDWKIHIFTQTVYVIVGTNTLRFQGTGPEDTYGLCIDNVKLIRFGTNKNIVINGDFESLNLNG